MKKISLMLALFLILSIAMSAVFTVSAARTISTDKTSYSVGEEIKVTATGTDKDWVGLYKADEVPGSVGNIYWYYCISDTVHSGDTVIINQLLFNGGRDGFTGEALPAGNYSIYLLENDGYNILQKIDIVVGDTEDTSMPEESSQAGEAVTQDITTEKTTYTVGEEIKVTASGMNKDWVAIFKDTEVPGTDTSIFWFYCNSDTVKPGDTVVLNQLTFNSGRSDFTTEVLPAGNYTIYLFENDGYNVLKSINITITEESGSNSSSEISNSDVSGVTSTESETSGTDNPKTGDTGLFIFAVSLVLIGSAIFYIINKKRFNNVV